MSVVGVVALHRPVQISLEGFARVGVVSTLNALKAYWVAQGISCGDPASAADLATFEARYRV